VQGDGSIRKIAKSTGQLKPAKQTLTMTPANNNYGHFTFLVRVNDSPGATFMWDTGASYTSISQRTARRLGILGSNNQPINGFRYQPGVINAVLANGALSPSRRMNNVPITFVGYGQETVRGTIFISQNDDNSTSLYGLSHIQNVKTLKIKNRAS
jgi:predicted aspartyl protease